MLLVLQRNWSKLDFVVLYSSLVFGGLDFECFSDFVVVMNELINSVLEIPIKIGNLPVMDCKIGKFLLKVRGNLLSVCLNKLGKLDFGSFLLFFVFQLNDLESIF